ncbi:MAG: toprim domain-containing protein [Prevotella sp.]|nr:toprim domain-containing protein [Prevotella sp.]
MNIEQAKQIRLEDFLLSLGHLPVRHSGIKTWYYSPLRIERTPSFKVNTNRNLWYDYGLGKGGGIIELMMEMHHTRDISHILKLLVKQSPVSISMLSTTFRPLPSEPVFKNVEALPLSKPALLKYLAERCLDIAICQKYCREVHYSIKNKRYFAIGFPNRAGGYELRNPFYKGCMTPKDISIINTDDQQHECCVFEGFADFLSYLTFQQHNNSPFGSNSHQDFVVLNSVSNLRKAIPVLADYGSILTFLDNDKAGQDAHQRIATEYGDKVQNMSLFFPDFKDVNDFLCKSGR